MGTPPRTPGLPLLTVETLTDEDVDEEIAQLDTDLATLYAFKKIRRGPLVERLRVTVVEIINLRRKGLR